MKVHSLAGARAERPFGKNMVINWLKMVINVVINPEALETMRESQDI
jgi:hypothetical protein